jgi:serine/threonine-protein kinase HipA
VKRSASVFLGDRPSAIGTLRFDADGARESSAFAYAGDFIESADGFAVEPALPLVTGFQFHRKTPDGSAFHGAIADTEPDGWGRRVVLRDHARRRRPRRGATSGSVPLTSIDFLLAVDDPSRIGALRFQDEQGVFQCAYAEGARRAPPLVELGRLLSASRAVETSSETAADLEYLRGRGTSLGGLRPKCTVVDEDGSLCIGKFPSVGDQRAVTKGEVLALRLAAAAGITSASARLVEHDGIPVAVIRRFDRRPEGKRLMYVSAATMLGAGPEERTPHAYTEIVDAIRRFGADAAADIEELWRRVAFSIAINNVDDHLRNHGFLHAGRGLWRLSPAFDLNPAPDRARELTTWISEESGPQAAVEELRAVAPYFRVSSRRGREILSSVRRAVAGWRRMGRQLGMTAAELEAFAPAFEQAGNG